MGHQDVNNMIELYLYLFFLFIITLSALFIYDDITNFEVVIICTYCEKINNLGFRKHHKILENMDILNIRCKRCNAKLNKELKKKYKREKK